ncbi:MAG: DUF308 domain-containing protein [Erysipelotrichaceae bacterium]|nr:DUF308 domain-containing protein [Erysipelotrichaceae bacterium]
MIEKIKAFKWQQIFISLLTVLAGGLLYVTTQDVATVSIQIISIGLIVFGIFTIIRYFFLDIRVTLYRNDFIFGLMFILFGAMVMVNKEYFMTLVPMMLGAIVVLSGISKIQDAIDSFRMGYPKFSFYILLSLLSLIIGLYAIFNPKDLVIGTFSLPLYQLLGIGLIYSGICDLISSLYLSKLFNDYLDDINYEEEEEEEDTTEDTKVENPKPVETTQVPITPIDITPAEVKEPEGVDNLNLGDNSITLELPKEDKVEEEKITLE